MQCVNVSLLRQVIISEFGTNFKYPTDYTWLPLFLNYTDGHYTSAAQSDLFPNHLGMSWCGRCCFGNTPTLLCFILPHCIGVTTP